MAPALINIVFRYELLPTATINKYPKLYNDCKEIFKSEVDFMVQMGRTLPNDFRQFESNLRERINENIESRVRSIGYNGVVEIPFSTDESGELKLKTSKLSFQIKEGNIQTDEFSIHLYFHSEQLTLVGTLADKLLIAVGDKTDEIANKTPISVFSIKHSPDIWLDSYKKI